MARASSLHMRHMPKIFQKVPVKEYTPDEKIRTLCTTKARKLEHQEILLEKAESQYKSSDGHVPTLASTAWSIEPIPLHGGLLEYLDTPLKASSDLTIQGPARAWYSTSISNMHQLYLRAVTPDGNMFYPNTLSSTPECPAIQIRTVIGTVTYILQRSLGNGAC